MPNWIKAKAYADKYKIARTKVYQDVAFGRIPKKAWKKKILQKELLLIDANFKPVDNRKTKARKWGCG